MKQSEIVSHPIGDGAATIFECSNSQNFKIPRLTIMTPFRLGSLDEKDEPASSICLRSEATRQLFEALKNYYERNHE